MKFNHKKLSIIVLLVVLTIGFSGCNSNGSNIFNNYDTFTEKEALKERDIFISDLEKYNNELKSGNFTNVRKMTKLLIDNYYQWSIEEYEKQERKIKPEDDWTLAELTSCGGYMQCNQYKIVKFGITKEELSDFIKNNNYNTAFLRFALLSAMKQDFPMTKKAQEKWDVVENVDNDEGEKNKLSHGNEIRIHQIRVLQLSEGLDIK